MAITGIGLDRGDERSAGPCRLDNHYRRRQPGDDPVARTKTPAVTLDRERGSLNLGTVDRHLPGAPLTYGTRLELRATHLGSRRERILPDMR